MKKTSWKTTLSGIAVILGALASALKTGLDGDWPTAITALVTGIPAGVGLIAARDNDVTSEQAGAAKPATPPAPATIPPTP